MRLEVVNLATPEHKAEFVTDTEWPALRPANVIPQRVTGLIMGLKTWTKPHPKAKTDHSYAKAFAKAFNNPPPDWQNLITEQAKLR